MLCLLVTFGCGVAAFVLKDDDRPAMHKAMLVGLSCVAMIELCADCMGFSRCLVGEADYQNPLYDYGVGMVLHFKLLKFLAVMFLVLSLLSTPSLFLFYSGTAYPTGQLTGVQSLAWSTLGSIGEAEPFCKKVALTGNVTTVTLSCPNEKLAFQKFTAFYGNPEGHCGCSEKPCSQAGMAAGQECLLSLPPPPTTCSPCPRLQLRATKTTRRRARTARSRASL